MNLSMLGKLLTDCFSGIIVLDEEKKIMWSNNLIEKICNDKSPLNKKFSEVFSIKLDEIIKEFKIIKTLPGNIYNLKARYIEDEKIYIVYVQEITDIYNKDIKLYCLEKIIESINDGIIISNHEGRVVLYNKAQENLEELLAEKVVGKHLWEVYEYNPECNPEMAEHRRVYKTREPIIERYRAHTYKNGIPKYLSYSTYPIIKDEEVIGVYSISKNETSLQALLSETIELKRKLFSKGEEKEEKFKNNGTTYTFSSIVGSSDVTKSIIKEAETVSLLNNTVLIVGETGTGKEVFAQSIHNFGKNKDEPFVAINCAAIPENLLESTLFGTIKGAYTGAVTQSGLFEEARNGTLFLDELNSMPISMQSKLLRVLQERVVRRVGGAAVTPIQCRVITAINEEPSKLIDEGRLRQDLFYRISGFCLYIPPLRDRKEDVICIGEYFVKKYNKLLNRNIETFSTKLRDIMLSYKWPGNIRELEHFVENMMIKAAENQRELDYEDIPRYIKNEILNEVAVNIIEDNEKTLPEFLRFEEKKIIINSLNKNLWNLTRTAKDLGIIRQSLEYRMKKLDIKRNIK
ncbi:arginine utilization regulatory protein [Clostridium pascui]|uniref:sigma-54 interaction domain-containing protein n=1 Tax=Clostridium pascui TaxID=46609 RepID=UPI00195DE4F3|nr:sigma 54-interacting transcriptional regulator [Clostridium pascui]MBM7869388.1 arginine utilization regulatory protein [Clostridium pascui]